MPSFKFLLLLWAFVCLIAVMLAVHHAQAAPLSGAEPAHRSEPAGSSAPPPSHPPAATDAATLLILSCR